jgi:hypothetical protein
VTPGSGSGKLLIECGEQSLREFLAADDAGLIGRIEAVRDIGVAHKVDLDILIYSGVSSPLSGGRPDRVSLQRAESLARSLNAEGVRFCLAINGGLKLGPVLSEEILRQVDPLLDIIAGAGSENGIRNSVVITHPGLLPYVRASYPELETIASCIQPLYPFAEHDYRTAFERYDYVVPLNQHATPTFLSNYREYVDRMLVFLTLGCGTPHFAKCYAHYLSIESHYPTNEAYAKRVHPRSLNIIPCQLSEPHRDCDYGALSERADDLEALLRMGVRKFKIPRNGLLRTRVLLQLLRMFNQFNPFARQSALRSTARD